MTSTIAMDPRIRARRDEVEAEYDRRRSLRFVLFAVILALVVGLAASTRSPLLDVDTISVSGARQTPTDEVRSISGIVEGDPLTDLDLGAARQAIAALPWVNSVTSLRRWDGTVEFGISERVPVAQTVSLDREVVTIVDAEGRVLGRLAEPRTDLVTVIGAEGSNVPGGWLADSALDAVSVAADLPSALTRVVDEVAVDEAGSITLIVAEVGPVRLGSSIDLELKFTALETMLSQVDLNCVSVLDLQVPTVPVLTRTGSC